jgi:hypothetical protein
LKGSYFAQAKNNLSVAERAMASGSLLDLMGAA